MRRRFRDILCALTVLFGVGLLSGCGNQYSSAMVYGLRTDPLVVAKPETLELDYPFTYKPDRPGQLPLMSMADIRDERNPYYYLEAADKKKMFLDPTKIDEKLKSTFAKVLAQFFGTPARPRVSIPDVSLDELDTLVLDRATLAKGSYLYRLHCLQCHGLTGNGRGPTAPWVNPHPRDYRRGLFKFQSVDQTDGNFYKPRREDLRRTLYYGVEGTSMPAFNLLPDDELEALVSYVIHLSIRGETERSTFVALDVDEETGRLSAEGLPLELPEVVKTLAKKTFQTWLDSQRRKIKASAYPEYQDDNQKRASILRGKALFLGDVELLKESFPKEEFVERYSSKLFGGKSADEISEKLYDTELARFAKTVSCVSCHVDYGRGAPNIIDEWGTLTNAANLLTGVYRGGRRPIDIYWRIHSGINGSGMNRFGKDLQGEQIWDLVNFVQALPYPAMLPKD